MLLRPRREMSWMLAAACLVACAGTVGTTTLPGRDAPDASVVDAHAGDAVTDDASDAAMTDASTVDASDDVRTDAAARVARPVAPLSTSRVTSRRPVFRWRLPPGEESARVEVCADRACATVEQTFTARGESASATADLAPGVHFWRLRDGSGGASSAPWEFFVGRRTGAPAVSYGSVSDLNADGAIDLVVGAPGADPGAVHVFMGVAGELPNSPTYVLRQTTDARRFGWDIHMLGDVNGDGYPELSVEDGERAWLFLGRHDGPSREPASVVQAASFQGVGDVNGDGYADLARAADLTFALVMGGPSAALMPWGRALAGEFVAGVGDLDGDGRAELALVTRTRVAIYRGDDDPFARPAWFMLPDAPSGTRIGAALCAGDVNGDGHPDLALHVISTAPTAPPPEVLLVFALGPPDALAPPSTTTFPEGFRMPRFTISFAAAGDVNGDGFDDLLVGNGGALVYAGSAQGIAPAALGNIGGGGPASLTGMGDVDRDGYEDVVVGPASEARLHLGSPSGPRSPARLVITESASQSQFGAVVRGWQ